MPTDQATPARWLKTLNPLWDGSPDDARRGKLTVLLGLIIMAAGVLYGALYGALGVKLAYIGPAVGAVISACALLVFRRTGSTRAAAHLIALAPFFAVAWVAASSGGIHSVALPWFLVVPMIAALLDGRRSGAVWVGLALGVISSFYVLEAVGIEPPDYVPDGYRTLFDYLVPAGLVLCGFSFVWAYERAREEAMERLRAAHEDAHRAHTHARAVLDNVGEGLALVRTDGVLQPARSLALERLFGTPSDGDSVWDLLRHADAGVAAQVEVGWDQVGSEWLPPDVALEQLPTRLEAEARVLELHWSPAGDDGEVMFVATDITARVKAEEERREQEELVNILARIGRSREQVVDFARDARRIVDALLEGGGTPSQERRWIHTLKGNAAVMGLGRLARWLHGLETALQDEARDPDSAERAALDEQWSRVEDRISEIVGTAEDDSIRVASAELDNAISLVVAGEPRPRVAARMQSWAWDNAKPRLEHLAEQAKRLAQGLDKTIEVRVDDGGARTPPSQEWRALWSSLVHLVRNAVDHGLERDRTGSGKPGVGVLSLSTERVGDTLQLEVRDDGAGIDWGALEAKAREHGRTLRTQADRVDWLFSDGATSRDEVSEVSGRGVGTAAVRESVHALGGTILVETELGRFTRFALAIPLAESTPAANHPAARVSA